MESLQQTCEEPMSAVFTTEVTEGHTGEGEHGARKLYVTETPLTNFQSSSLPVARFPQARQHKSKVEPSTLLAFEQAEPLITPKFQVSPVNASSEAQH